ncbi:N-acetylglucosamine kinase [Fodinicola acaciae]|uniref:N-acetylglucosamine kinase n=1 Tax=Fodinicola acaciae TaxID=2681555 RepID=UPI0013D4E05A|nr:BadF/BadG/BcrA/BcrD ATPase family protein [Fodinicola acaciae]
MEPIVVGVDAGGTNTRAMAATLDGDVIGTAVSTAGNPVAVGLDVAAKAILDSVIRALGETPLAAVRTVLVGGAGGGSEEFDQAVRDRLVASGVRAESFVGPDLEAAFGSGTPEPDGYAMIAGTGSTTGRIEGHRMVQSVGGSGWLLGDEGAGFWLGREAVRAALEVCDQIGPATGLTDRVVEAFGGAYDREAIIAEVYRRPPIWLASLAPLVTEASDSVAQSIMDRAADALAQLLGSLRPVPGKPVVLTGGVVGPASPIGGLLDARLRTLGLDPVVVRNGLAGATWLAILQHRPDAGPGVHARLVARV